MEVEKKTMVNASIIFSNNYCTDHDEETLPGFRFHPTDEELVGFYLRRKVEKKPLSIELIKHVDIYKYDPWDLPKVSNVGEKEWYFFCRRGRKYRNSIRPNRVTRSGFWKATGIDKPIYSVGETHRDCIGLKKSLVYYRGSAGKGTKTDWMMHEFRLPPTRCSGGPFNSKDNNNNAQEAEVWTLCRIIKRESSNKKYTPDFQKTSSKQNIYTTDSNSSITCSFNSDDDRQKNKTSGVFGTDQRKPVGNIDYTHEMTKELLAGQLSLASSQVPCGTGSYLSFSDQSNGGDEFSGDRNWDELRPMIDFALDPSSLFYSFR